jgi:peptidoglycan LD-endopeptidase LytH
MRSVRVRCVRVGGLVFLLGALVLLSSCASLPSVVATPTLAPVPSDDDDFSELIAQLRSDLNLHNGRPMATMVVKAESKVEREGELARRARALFAPLNGTALLMPVVGVRPYELSDNWGDPRDGGKRKHKGIDIFAPRGTPVVAVADGIVSYIGEQPKGGRCLWLATDGGESFYYAHLDRWAAGLFEGMEVRSGDLLGYVGNTGNAKTTPSHLHFAVSQNDAMVDPFPILTKAIAVRRARLQVESGVAMGTR